jgi:hypothetical protein
MISDTMESAGFGTPCPGDTKLGERTPAQSVAGFRKGWLGQARLGRELRGGRQRNRAISMLGIAEHKMNWQLPASPLRTLRAEWPTTIRSP